MATAGSTSTVVVKQSAVSIVTWVIKDFVQLMTASNNNGDDTKTDRPACVESEVFRGDKNTKWRLRMYPGGFDDKNYVSVYLQFEENNEQQSARARFNFSIRDVVNKKSVLTIDTPNTYTFVPGTDWGNKLFVPHTTLLASKKELMPNGQLTLVCQLHMKDDKHSEKSAVSNNARLIQDLKRRREDAEKETREAIIRTEDLKRQLDVVEKQIRQAMITTPLAFTESITLQSRPTDEANESTVAEIRADEPISIPISHAKLEEKAEAPPAVQRAAARTELELARQRPLLKGLRNNLDNQTPQPSPEKQNDAVEKGRRQAMVEVPVTFEEEASLAESIMPKGIGAASNVTYTSVPKQPQLPAPVDSASDQPDAPTIPSVVSSSSSVADSVESVQTTRMFKSVNPLIQLILDEERDMEMGVTKTQQELLFESIMEDVCCKLSEVVYETTSVPATAPNQPKVPADVSSLNTLPADLLNALPQLPPPAKSNTPSPLKTLETAKNKNMHTNDDKHSEKSALNNNAKAVAAARLIQDLKRQRETTDVVEKECRQAAAPSAITEEALPIQSVVPEATGAAPNKINTCMPEQQQQLPAPATNDASSGQVDKLILLSKQYETDEHAPMNRDCVRLMEANVDEMLKVRAMSNVSEKDRQVSCVKHLLEMQEDLNRYERKLREYNRKAKDLLAGAPNQPNASPADVSSLNTQPAVLLNTVPQLLSQSNTPADLLKTPETAPSIAATVSSTSPSASSSSAFQAFGRDSAADVIVENDSTNSSECEWNSTNSEKDLLTTLRRESVNSSPFVVADVVPESQFASSDLSMYYYCSWPTCGKKFESLNDIQRHVRRYGHGRTQDCPRVASTQAEAAEGAPNADDLDSRVRSAVNSAMSNVSLNSSTLIFSPPSYTVDRASGRVRFSFTLKN